MALVFRRFIEALSVLQPTAPSGFCASFQL